MEYRQPDSLLTMRRLPARVARSVALLVLLTPPAEGDATIGGSARNRQPTPLACTSGQYMYTNASDAWRKAEGHCGTSLGGWLSGWHASMGDVCTTDSECPLKLKAYPSEGHVSYDAGKCGPLYTYSAAGRHPAAAEGVAEMTACFDRCDFLLIFYWSSIEIGASIDTPTAAARAATT